MTSKAKENDLAKLRKRADAATEDAQDAVAALNPVVAPGGVTEAERAAAKVEVARQAQGDVDRLEQRTRAGLDAVEIPSVTGPHGVKGDAWGGSAAEAAERAAAEEKAGS